MSARLNFVNAVNEVHDAIQGRVTIIADDLRLRGWEDDAIRQIMRKAIVGLLDVH